jgi:glycosyltransferase involved in cell wall biosynthesis
MLLTELAAKHDVTLLALAWNDEDYETLAELARQGLDVHAISHGRRTRLRAAFGDPRRPLQQIVATSHAFAQHTHKLIAHAELRLDRPYDVVHVEHLRGAAAIGLDAPLGVRTIFDAVDCIAELARLTALYGPHAVLRAVARYEIERTRRYEARLLNCCDSVSVVAERDRRALLQASRSGHVVVIPNGVAALPHPVMLPKDPVAVFSGKLSFHANQAAARWLLNEIWPRVRAAVPEARLVIAGAEAPAWLDRWDGAAGVTLVKDPPDLMAIIGGTRVALAPMRYAVGIQNKVLEAMGCGVPVVSTSAGAAGLLPEAAGTYMLADTADAFAARVTHLMNDLPTALEFGELGHAYVRRYHTWMRARTQFEALYRPMRRSEVAA